MFPLLETIRFENGVFNNVECHFQRMQQSVNDCFNKFIQFNFNQVLIEAQQSMAGKTDLFKFRLLYSNKGYRWEFIPYILPDIKTLKMVVDNQIEYGYKFSDRDRLTRLTALKGNADEIVIVKNNEITDTSFANVIFFDGNRWVTPKHPLLPGTQRAFLLKNRIISEAIITPVDVPAFQKAAIINAMIRFEDKPEVKIVVD